MDPISAIIAALSWVFTSSQLAAQVVRFVGSMLITAALSGSKQPRLTDLKIQASGYGQPIPRLYGEAVRVAGNVIDKSDLIPIKHKKGEILGLGGVKYYTYDAHLAILLCEGGNIPIGGLRRIFADGKVIFDRDASGATPGIVDYLGAEDCVGWTKANRTQRYMVSVRFYPGTATQGVDSLVQSLHPGEPVPAYRHSAYVVLERFETETFGGRVPNFEFEVETETETVGECVAAIGAAADVEINVDELRELPLRGFVFAQDGTAWTGIEPLAGAFSFDLVSRGDTFKALRRGRRMRTIIPSHKLAAQPPAGRRKDTKDVRREGPTKLPEEVTLTYWERERDYQPNTQRAFRPQPISSNKVHIELPLVLTANEARDIVQRALFESIAASKTNTFTVSNEYRWLEGGDVVGLTIGDNIEPFRLMEITLSPNKVVEMRGWFEDPLLYVGGLVGAEGTFPEQTVELPGVTIFQPIDGPILRDADDDTGFYATFSGSGPGWVGAFLDRANPATPTSFTTLGDIGVAAPMGDCATVLPVGVSGVLDMTSTVDVEIIGDEAPESTTLDLMLIENANLAWIGTHDGSGEVINFLTVTPLGGGVYRLSGLLRGRYGTDHAMGEHGPDERFVLVQDAEARYRLDFGPVDWGVNWIYRARSIGGVDGEDDYIQPFTNMGEGKRPYSPVHVLGARNDDNDDLLITWDRRTRYQAPPPGSGPTPLGESVESYEVDILDAPGGVVLRTLSSAAPEVVYPGAELVADGFTPGDFVPVVVYQMSDVRGRGRPGAATV